MALILEYTSPEYGVTSTSSYARIVSYEGTIDYTFFHVLIYADQNARITGKQAIGQFNFQVPYVDGATYAQIYAHLKTLPGFENAVDLI